MIKQEQTKLKINQKISGPNNKTPYNNKSNRKLDDYESIKSSLHF